MGTFAQNSMIMRGNSAVALAVMQLSLADYIVLKTTTDGFTGKVSILIDKPFQGAEVQVSHHGDKAFASFEYYGCRVYWPAPQEAAA